MLSGCDPDIVYCVKLRAGGSRSAEVAVATAESGAVTVSYISGAAGSASGADGAPAIAATAQPQIGLICRWQRPAL